METFIYYLLKSSLLLTGFYLVYHFLLRKETFFRANRLFLWMGYLVSLILPLITYVKTVVVETPTFTLSENMQVSHNQAEVFSIDWIDVAGVVYGLGLLFFGLKLTFNLVQLIKTIRKHSFQRLDNLLIAEDSTDKSPFSFFNFIFLSKSGFSEKEAYYIFKHEQAHAKGYHSFDLLFANLHTTLFWFHPFAWWYKAAINQNLEFMADAQAIASEIDKNSYQLTLLKSLSINPNLPLTHPFYQSFLKNRIVMMNQRKSPTSKAVRFFAITPLLLFFIFFFQIETRLKAQNSIQKTESYSHVFTEIITPETTHNQLESIEKAFDKKMNLSIQFKNIKRDSDFKILSLDVVTKENKKTKITSIGGKDSFDSFVLVTRTNNMIDWNIKILINPSSETYESFLPKVKILDEINPQTIDTNSINPKPHLVVVDGQILSKKLDSYGLSSIMDPLSIKSFNVLNSQDAFDKYGQQAKDGAIEITTKEVPKEVLENLKKGKEILLKSDYPENVFFMLNGKRSSKAEIEKLNPDDIRTINVLKGKNATDKYGNLGKNGVIEVFTKIY